MNTITDSKRFFSLLEPQHNRRPELHQVVIEEALRTRKSARQAQPHVRVPNARGPKIKPKTAPKVLVVARESKPQSAFDRFLRGMDLNYESWRDGLGYDLSMLKTAGPQELTQIEEFLVSRPVYDWRDVQALAALDSPRARALLRKTLRGRDQVLATAVMDYAPELASEKEQTKTLVAALTRSDSDVGTIQALFQVEEFHPPDVVDALFRGLLTRDGKTAEHFAAMLMFVRGKANSSFDWDQRPFFLKFNTEVHAEREAVFRELCEKLGVDGTRYLAAANEESSARPSDRSPK
jgi:hypothetical protein